MADAWDIFRVKEFRQAHGVDGAAVRQMIETGKLLPDDCVRRSGEKEWRPVSQMRSELYGAELKTEERPTLKIGEPTGEIILPPGKQQKPRKIHHDSWADLDLRDSFAGGRGQLPGIDDHGFSQPALHDDSEEEEEFVWERRHLELEEFDLTPMVDMTFLLNMFFMLTTSYALLRSIEIPAPAPTSRTAQSKPISLDDIQEGSIMININADNTVLVEDEKAPLDRLGEAIKRVMRDTGKVEAVISGDPECFHQTVMTVYDVASDVGLTRVRLANTKDDGG